MAVPDAVIHDDLELLPQRGHRDRIDLDIKHVDTQIESGQMDGGTKVSGDTPVSPFRDMPRMKAVRVFWFTCLCAFLIAIVAIMDGYLITSRSHST